MVLFVRAGVAAGGQKENRSCAWLSNYEHLPECQQPGFSTQALEKSAVGGFNFYHSHLRFKEKIQAYLQIPFNEMFYFKPVRWQ